MNRSTQQFNDDRLKQDAIQRFCDLVESVGVKRFSASLGVGTRQVNRIISGAQPNPIERLVRCLQSAEPEVGDRALDYICQEMGGHFVRMEGINQVTVNAVRECAEAIAAISDGHVSDLDIKEIRDAISALAALSMSIKNQRRNWGNEPT